MVNRIFRSTFKLREFVEGHSHSEYTRCFTVADRKRLNARWCDLVQDQEHTIRHHADLKARRNSSRPRKGLPLAETLPNLCAETL